MAHLLQLKDLLNFIPKPGMVLSLDGDGAEALAVRLGKKFAASLAFAGKVYRDDERDLFEQAYEATLFSKSCFVLIGFKTVPDAGAHCIITAEKQTRSTHVLSLPKAVSSEDFATIVMLLWPDTPREQLSLLPLISSIKDLKVDYACLLADYQRIVGRAAQQFGKEWITRLMPAEKKLFALSEALLSGDRKEVIIRWHTVSRLYAAEFWTVYLSELFWNGFLFSKTAHEQGVAAAKELGLRLPFGFMQQGYKRFSRERCAKNLALIAETDSLIKRGGSFLLIDRCLLSCC
jgi:hypothetical protein